VGKKGEGKGREGLRVGKRGRGRVKVVKNG
jgi:hypothetical protein